MKRTNRIMAAIWLSLFLILLPEGAFASETNVPPAGTASGSAANGEEKDFNDVLLSLPFVLPPVI